MSIPWRWRSVSIYGRTLLLMLAVLLVAEAIGFLLPVNHYAQEEGPLPLSLIARLIQQEEFQTPGRGPPPDNDPQFHRPLNEEPPGPPMGPRDVMNLRGGFWSHPGTDVRVRTSVAQPTNANPAFARLRSSDGLREELAHMLHVDSARVVFYADAGDTSMSAGPSAHDALLAGSFVAAWQMQDGRWRWAERIVEGFPTTSQKRALLVFVLGLLVLFPIAWAFARALVSPIQRFAEAARRVGNDQSAPPLPRQGPSEMLAAVDAFNAMQARLNRLIRERTHMVGAIAHDLRTPLTRLAFRLDDLPAPLGDKVNADIQEMKSMISAALDFIRDRSLEGSHELLDFRLAVERVVDDQSDLGHDVTLQAGQPITVEGNPLALRRMVINLIENALKYGERVRLRMSARSGRCTLEIDDDGPGIPEALQAQVFEPFYRMETSRNRDTGGIGLGLSSVRAIVLDHGGDIALGNRKGGGLRVTVVLPTANGPR